MIYFIRCIACKEFTYAKNFPLCPDCHHSVNYSSPTFCQQCGSVECKDNCINPWLKRSEILSYHARYLYFARTQRVIRSWSMNNGYFFNKRVLTDDSQLNKKLKNLHYSFIITMPNATRLTWRNPNNPNYLIANWINQKNKKPIFIFEVLKRKKITFFKKSANILLVGDVLRRRKNLFYCCDYLKSIGLKKIHVFFLALYPLEKTFSHNEIMKHLPQTHLTKTNTLPLG